MVCRIPHQKLAIKVKYSNSDASINMELDKSLCEDKGSQIKPGLDLRMDLTYVQYLPTFTGLIK